MQKNRLFNIIYYILEKGKVTAPELSEKFEVSIRTIYRDIDTISSAGIPIYATQGKGGGISILDEFVLEKSLFTENEREQILNALQSFAVVDEKETTELLTKLNALFQTKATSWIEIDFSDWSQHKPEKAIFESIKVAIFEHNVVSFVYFGNNGSESNRRVRPFKLVFKSKNWYLYGFCLLRNDYRFFKLTRIKDFAIHNETFSPTVIPSIIERNTFVEDTIDVKLRFDKQVAFRVYDEFSGNVIEDEEGYLNVHMKLPNSEVMFSYLFSFSEYVEVLEPRDVREKMAEKIKKIEKKYRT